MASPLKELNYEDYGTIEEVYESDSTTFESEFYQSDNGSVYSDTAYGLENAAEFVQKYDTLTFSQVQQLIKQDAEFLARKYQLPNTVSLALLRQNGWSCTQTLTELDSNRQGMLKSIGIVTPITPEKWSTSCAVKNVRDPQARCAICHSSATESQSGSMMFIVLPCLHELCQACIKSYLELKLSDGTVHNIPCPVQVECPITISHQTIQSVLKQSRSRLEHLDTLNFISLSGHIRECTSPYCDFLVRLCTTNKCVDVQCVCGNSFCFSCSQSHHSPVSCEIVEKWLIITGSANATQQWINLHTRACPKCGVQIYRDEGCNHVKCGKCFFEFCWSCNKDWKLHPGTYFNCLMTQEQRKSQNSSGQHPSMIERSYWRCLGKFEAYKELAGVINTENPNSGDSPSRTSAALLTAWGYALLFFIADSSVKYMLEYALGETEAVLAAFDTTDDTNVAPARVHLLKTRTAALADLVKFTKWPIDKAAYKWKRPT